MREVGIAVGMTLFSNLNEANHWEKHNQIPKPASEHIRSFVSENDRRHSDGEKERDRENNCPDWYGVVWMGIEDGKVCRPQCLPKVNHVADERVLHAPKERQWRDCASSAFLQHKCDETGTRRKKKQGNLFQEELLLCAQLFAGV